MTLAPLAGRASRRAEPGSGEPCRRWRHDPFRARIPDTVPSGLAPPAAPQRREGVAVAPLAGRASRRAQPGFGEPWHPQRREAPVAGSGSRRAEPAA
jgi:hypothetical protein